MDFSRCDVEWVHVVGTAITVAVLVSVWCWGHLYRGWGR